jgi:hypothetical protein
MFYKLQFFYFICKINTEAGYPLEKNYLKSPLIAYDTNEPILKFKIIFESKILQEFQCEDSFIDVLICLFAFYFVFDLEYPESFEIILVFFHESLKLKEMLRMKKKKGLNYVKFLNSVLSI